MQDQTSDDKAERKKTNLKAIRNLGKLIKGLLDEGYKTESDYCNQVFKNSVKGC